MFTRYHSLPRNRLFWEKEVDTDTPLIYEGNFETVERYIHFADNDYLNTADKFAKVHILYDAANKSVQQFRFFHNFCYIDEQVIP